MWSWSLSTSGLCVLGRATVLAWSSSSHRLSSVALLPSHQVRGEPGVGWWVPFLCQPKRCSSEAELAGDAFSHFCEIHFLQLWLMPCSPVSLGKTEANMQVPPRVLYVEQMYLSSFTVSPSTVSPEHLRAAVSSFYPCRSLSPC